MVLRPPVRNGRWSFYTHFKNCAGATEGEVRDMKIRVIHDFYDKENDLELRKTG